MDAFLPMVHLNIKEDRALAEFIAKHKEMVEHVSRAMNDSGDERYYKNNIELGIEEASTEGAAGSGAAGSGAAGSGAAGEGAAGSGAGDNGATADGAAADSSDESDS